MNALNVPLGPALRAAREARGQTMEEAAAALDVSLRTVWRWEHGARPNRLGRLALQRWIASPK